MTAEGAVEFAGIGPVPFAAMLLADMGADIIRIERPGGGMPGTEIVHRSRPTLVLDLKQDGARQKAMALVAESDGLIEGFRPGVMERLGFGPEPVLARNPRLVYGRMTGWGQSGPLASSAGHDINYIAVAGALGSFGPVEGRPVPPLNLVGDYGGGALYLALGLLAGLIEAGRSGQGQVVDCAMCDGAASLMTLFWSLHAAGLWTGGRGTNLLDGGAHYYSTYECADGRYVAVGAIEKQFYALLCEGLGVEDPAFREQDDRAAWPDLQEKLQVLFRTRTRDEWCTLFEGTDACVAPVLSMLEAPEHPHMAERRSFIDLDGVRQPAPAPRFTRTPSAVRPAPTLTFEEALQKWRGCS